MKFSFLLSLFLFQYHNALLETQTRYRLLKICHVAICDITSTVFLNNSRKIQLFLNWIQVSWILGTNYTSLKLKSNTLAHLNLICFGVLLNCLIMDLLAREDFLNLHFSFLYFVFHFSSQISIHYHFFILNQMIQRRIIYIILEFLIMSGFFLFFFLLFIFTYTTVELIMPLKSYTKKKNIKLFF